MKESGQRKRYGIGIKSMIGYQDLTLYQVLLQEEFYGFFRSMIIEILLMRRQKKLHLLLL